MPPAQNQKTLFLYNPRDKLHKAIVTDLLSLTAYNIREKCKDLKEAAELIDMWEVRMAVMFSTEKERCEQMGDLAKNTNFGTNELLSNINNFQEQNTSKQNINKMHVNGRKTEHSTSDESQNINITHVNSTNTDKTAFSDESQNINMTRVNVIKTGLNVQKMYSLNNSDKFTDNNLLKNTENDKRGTFFSNTDIFKSHNMEKSDCCNSSQNLNNNSKQPKHKREIVFNQFISIYYENKTYKFLITGLVPIFALLSRVNCEKQSNNLVVCDDIDELKPAFQFLFENGNCFENVENITHDIKHTDIRKVIFISKKAENIEIRVYVINQIDEKQTLEELGPRITCRLVDQWNGPIDYKRKQKSRQINYEKQSDEKDTKAIVDEQAS